MSGAPRASWTRLASSIFVLNLVACGESATAPQDLPPAAPEVIAPALVDTPSVPVPSSPGGEVPLASDTLTTIVRLDGDYDFNPIVTRAFAFWRLRETLNGGGSWTSVAVGNEWSHQLTSLESPFGLPSPPPPDPLTDPDSGDPLRLLLVDGGVPVEATSVCLPLTGCGVTSPNNRTFETRITSLLWHELVMNPLTFATDVYVKRERRWELESFPGAGVFQLVPSNGSISLADSYTQGSSETRIETFGRTLTAETGIDLQGLSAKLQTTLSRTFSTAVTVTVERSQEITISVTGEAGKLIDVRVWRLVDTYTLTGADGAPLSDPGYVFDSADRSMSWSTVVGTYPVQVKFGQ